MSVPPNTTEPPAWSPGNLLAAADARTGTWRRQAVALGFALLIAGVALVRRWPPEAVPQAEALLVPLGFALGARAIRATTWSGSTAGFCVTLPFYLVLGRSGFLALLTVFGVTWLSTRMGYARKLRQGTAERRHGRRASQVMSNLGVAAAAVAFAPHSAQGEIYFVLASVAALAEAAADTASSEIGQAFGGTPRLITNFRHRMPEGSNGGVTLLGTTAALVAAVLVIAVPVAVQLAANALSASPQTMIWSEMLTAYLVVIAAGMFGMFFDSLLGATVEQRWLNNDLVNLLGTASAAGAAYVLLQLV